MANVLNFVIFQAGWFAFVWGAARDEPWVGAPVLIVAIAFHLLRARRPGRELALLMTALALGMACDSALLHTNWLRYQSGTFLTGVAPGWIGGLWLLFATTLNSSLAWLRPHVWLAAGFGAVGGPMAYLGAQRLGAVELLNTGAALGALAVGWALLTPALCRLAMKLDGMHAESLIAHLPIYGSAPTARTASHV